MIQVHPQRAFLNSDVVISNTGDRPVLVKDSASDESFTLGPGEHTIARFQAGKHVLSTEDIEEAACFIVEDALKFGGSERKASYIFDDNPWAIIVMKDRTYFFNQETGVQFVEHDLSPEKIEEINKAYLLFKSEKDVSLFSLKKMAIVKTIPSVVDAYSDGIHCILHTDGGLIIYDLSPDKALWDSHSIQCDDFTIGVNLNKYYIRFFQKSEPGIIKTLDLKTEFEDGTMGSLTLKTFPGNFICFSGNRSILYWIAGKDSAMPTTICAYDLENKNSCVIYNSPDPVSVVNDITIWENKEYKDLLHGNTQKGESTRITLSVIERNGQIFFIQNFSHISVVQEKTKRYSQYTLTSYSQDFTYSSEKVLCFSRHGDYDYVKDGDKIFLLSPTFKEKKGDVHFSKYGDPVFRYKDENGVHYETINDISILVKEPFNLFDRIPWFSTGLIPVDKKYLWIKDGKLYSGFSSKEIFGFSILSGFNSTDPQLLFAPDGTVWPVPLSLDDAIAISDSGMAILYSKGGYYSIVRKRVHECDIQENIILSIYDTLHVKDAVFCSDGESFVYQKDKQLVLHNLVSGEEAVFDTESGIRQNINGYRPYCIKDSLSRPVIVDPVSLKTIDNEFLSQYQFASSDGSAFYVGRITKHFMKNSNEEVSDKEYKAFCNLYNFETNIFGLINTEENKEEKFERRRTFLEARNIAITPFTWGLSTPNFVRSYIIDDFEYVVINRNGSHHEVRLSSAPLYFLNYVSFSKGGDKVAIAGKYKDGTGICVVYDLDKEEELHRSFNSNTGGPGKTLAVWLGLFDISGNVAYYDSTPNTFLVRPGKKAITIPNRSLLTFSPSGKYMALSRQGYIPYGEMEPDGFWGHVPCCDVYIVKTDDPNHTLCQYIDHGSQIMGVASYHDTVASASFSADEKRILTVSKDGVVVVRNLHLK